MRAICHSGARILGILSDFLFGAGRAAKTIETAAKTAQTAAERLKKDAEENLKKTEAWREATEKHLEAVKNGTDGNFVGRHRKAAGEVREMIQELSADRGLALFFTALIENRDEPMKDRRPLRDIPFQFSPGELEELAKALETAANCGVGAVELHRRHRVLTHRMALARNYIERKERLDANPRAAEMFYDMMNGKSRL